MAQMLTMFFPKRENPNIRQLEVMTVHLLSRKIEKGNAEQSCKPRIDQGSSNSSYCKIVCDQYVRLPHDPYNSRNDLVDWLKKQANDNEI